MAFPTSFDTYTTKVDGVTDVIAADVNSVQNTLTELQTKVGINGSAVTASHTYKIAALETAIASVDGMFRAARVYTTAGANTWTKPAGLKRVKVTVVGGGGGGANDIGSISNFNGAGAGGGASIKWIEAGSLGATVTATVGAGGTGATGASALAGTAGGTSSFGAHCSATGGSGGAVLSGTPVVPAAGGSGSGGNINLAGTPGGTTEVVETSYWSGGRGGDSYLGTGGLGGKDDAAGVVGVGYGAGGGSGYAVGSTDRNGANGTAGVVIVEEFF